MTAAPSPPALVPRAGLDPAHVVDVFVYVVVLNLATQWVPQVITESFSTSVLVAVLLKLVLEGVLAVKTWARRRFSAARTPAGRVVGALTLLVVLPGSKIVVLEVVAFVFGDAVDLGGFFLVTGLIVALLLARLGVRRLLRPTTAAGDPAGPTAVSAERRA